jgi:hypothetical protein
MVMGLSRSAFSADAAAGMNAKAQAMKKAADEVKARKLLVRLFGILTMLSARFQIWRNTC